MSKIIITIGHGKADNGGYDSGAISKDGKYHEFKIAREVGKYAQQYYNSTYNEQCDLMNYDGSLTLQQRADRLKNNTYDFVCEIHLNAGGGTGTECFYSHSDSYGKKIAQAISSKIASTFNIVNRGAKTMLDSSGNDYLCIIREPWATSTLVECCFIDTATDLNLIKTVAGQKKFGIAIAQAIASAREISKKFIPCQVKIKKKSGVYKYAYKDPIGCKSIPIRTLAKGTAVTLLYDLGSGWSRIEVNGNKYYIPNTRLKKSGLSAYTTVKLSKGKKVYRIKNGKLCKATTLIKKRKFTVICSISAGKYQGYKVLNRNSKEYYYK